VALEACGSGHWWARKIKAVGHEVVLLHAKFIRPFVQTNKTDAADARAIWTAVQQPEMRTVAAKTEDQQAMLALHRMRSLLVKFRTMQVNQLRGLLYEFGATFRAGRVAGLAEVRARMAELAEALPGTMVCGLQDQLQRIDALEQDIDRLERQIGTWQNQQAACRAIAEVPGIGKLTATALVATMGDAKAFKSGREFASFLDWCQGKAVLGQDPIGIDLQARRPVLAHAVDSRREIGVVPCEGTHNMAARDSGPATGQRGSGGHGPQDGTNGMGDSGSWSGVSEGLRERKARVAD